MLAGVGIYWHLSRSISPHVSHQNTITVKVITTPVYEIYDEIEALGTTYANEAVNITTNTMDTISEILFEDGQFVKKDQIIVKLTQTEEIAQKKAIEARLHEHERELKRLANLLKRHALAETEFDARKTLLTIAKQNLLEIEAKIEDRNIRAPFDGFLGLRKISVGSLVQPGDIITTIDDIQQIKLDFSIPSSFLDVVKEGLAINAVTNAYENKIFRGVITKIGSRVNPRTRSIEIRAILDNPNRLLKPGLLMSINLFKNKRLAVLAPEEAVIQRQDAHFIFVIDPSKKVAELRQITIGARKPGWVEITSGLNEGELVVIRGFNMINDGQSVQFEMLEPVPHFKSRFNKNNTTYAQR